ncbi:MAG TPA: hypothetical protein PLR57_01430, partial [Clostridia bacterium]|nr:hypothetical protein [Clostridia bacterium]
LETLIDLGLGHLAGVENVRWMKQNSGEYTFEQVTNGRLYTGVPNARASCVISGSDALDVSYLPIAEAEEYSALYDSFRVRRSPCQTVVGGRVLIYPFGRFAGPQEIPPMLLNDVRQEILQDVLNRSGRLTAPMVEQNPYLVPYAFSSDDKAHLYLVNGSMDAVCGVPLLWANADGEYSVSALPSRGEPIAFTARIERDRCMLPLEIEPMESVLLTVRRVGE